MLGVWSKLINMYEIVVIFRRIIRRCMYVRLMKFKFVKLVFWFEVNVDSLWCG